MHIGTFVFTQIVQFFPQRQFRRIVAKYNDRTKGWSMSHWNHLLVLMFGQLMGCGSLRELTDITTAHAKKSKHLGPCSYILKAPTHKMLSVKIGCR